MLVLSKRRFSDRLSVPCRSLIIWDSFLQSSLSRDLTFMLINATAVWISVLGILMANSDLEKKCDKY